jgi:hypothetical protein
VLRLDVVPAVAAVSYARAAAGPVAGGGGDLMAVAPVPWVVRPDLAVAGESLPPLPPG